MKQLCVLGSYLTEEGKKIKAEMLSWLEKEYDIICVDQEVTSKLFEYPAIKRALELSISKNEPVLYIHTKGAGNKIPSYANSKRMMNPNYNVPKSAKPEDCQKVIRNLWKYEFTKERLKIYLKEVNNTKPIVCCPYTGPEKITWWNAWIINSAAAKIIMPKLKQTDYRWYYERIFRDEKDIEVKGIRMDDLKCDTLDSNKEFWDDIWQFYEENNV